MADDIKVPAGTGDSTVAPPVATDDIGGRHYQKIKAGWGTDGAFMETADTDGVRMPVGGGQIGTLTETAPASDTASSGLNGRLQRVAQRLTSLIAQLPATLGQKTMANALPVSIASDQSAVPVSGTVAITTSTTAAALAKAEEAAHASGDTGVMMLAVRADAPASLTTADQRYAPPQLDHLGAMRVNAAVDAIQPAATTLMTTVSTVANGTSFAVAGWKYVLLKVTGTMPAGTPAVIVLEVSFDGGTTWRIIPVGPLGGVTASQVSIQSIGDYGVDLPPGVTHLRPRTTAAPATTSITLTATAANRLAGAGTRVDAAPTIIDGPQVYGIDPDDHYLFVGTGGVIYDVGDVIGEATGGASIIFPGMARTPGGGGRLRKIRLMIKTSVAAATMQNLSFKMYMYRQQSAFSTLSDHDSYLLSSNSDCRRLLVGMPKTLSYVDSIPTPTGGEPHYMFESADIDVGYQCPAGQTSLLGHCRTQVAWTPGGSDYFDFQVDRIPD